MPIQELQSLSEEVVAVETEIHAELSSNSASLRHLESWQAKIPFNAEVTYATIRHLHAVGRFDECLSRCVELMRHGVRSSIAFFLKARAELALGMTRESQVSIRRAARLAPGDKLISELGREIDRRVSRRFGSAVYARPAAG